MAKSEPQWYCVITNPNAERRALMGLFGREIPHFWPTITKMVGAGKRRRPRVSGLFPRYIFARLRPDQMGAWRGIHGIAGLVQSGESAIPIPDELIDKLMRDEDDGRWDEARKRDQKIPQRGDKVRVIHEYLGELDAIVERSSNSRSVRVAIGRLIAHVPLDRIKEVA